MKILIATGLYPPEIGGPSTHTVLMEKNLPRHGIRVSVLPFSRVRHLPKGIRHFVYFLRCWFLALRHDLVFAQDTVSVGLPSSLAALFSGRFFVIRVPGDYVWEQAFQRFQVKEGIDDFQKRKYGFRVEFLRVIQKFVVNRADVVITPSNYFSKLVSGWVKNPGRVKTIYNGIDLEGTNHESRITNQGKVLVSAGRLVPWKGFDMLIEIMKDLPDWKLVILGDGPEREALELQTTNYKLQTRIKFTGRVTNKEVFEYYKKADVFVLNSTFESFSFQTVEAMAVGLPLVVTNIGSLPEIVGDAGILVEPNNKEQFIAAIKKVDNNYEQFSQKTFKQAQKFSINATIEGFAKIFKGLI